MSKLELGDALTRASGYSHAVVSFVDPDGYRAHILAKKKDYEDELAKERKAP